MVQACVVTPLATHVVLDHLPVAGSALCHLKFQGEMALVLLASELLLKDLIHAAVVEINAEAVAVQAWHIFRSDLNLCCCPTILDAAHYPAHRQLHKVGAVLASVEPVWLPIA